MSRLALPILALGSSLAFVTWGWPAESNREQARAIAEIEKLRRGVRSLLMIRFRASA